MRILFKNTFKQNQHQKSLRLIKKLQECATMGQADPILTKLGAGPAVKKLVETALVLSNSQDVQQRNHAYSFMESAIKELEDGEDNEDSKLYRKMHEQDDDDDEHKLHEEELDNHNNGPREGGSEQSSDNTEPYPGTGKDSTNGEKPIQDMSDTENQWSETNGMIVPGLAPDAGAGLAPDIAQEMGRNMPAPPPMDTNQMMRQMQYTAIHEIKKMMGPVIKKLERQITETKSHNGTMKLDLENLKSNATSRVRETVVSTTPEEIFSVQKLPHQKRHLLAIARSEIEQTNKMLNSNRNIYN